MFLADRVCMPKKRFDNADLKMLAHDPSTGLDKLSVRSSACSWSINEISRRVVYDLQNACTREEETELAILDSRAYLCRCCIPGFPLYTPTLPCTECMCLSAAKDEDYTAGVSFLREQYHVLSPRGYS